MKILAAAWGEGDEKERKVRLSELEVKESREPRPEAEICRRIARSSGVRAPLLVPQCIQHQFPLFSLTAIGRQATERESIDVSFVF